MFEVILSIVLALALDRFWPERWRVDPFAWYCDWAESIEHRFNGGAWGQGVTAVTVAVVPLALLVVIVRYLLGELGLPLRFVFDVVVLSWCVDVQRQSERADGVSDALSAGDMPVANENLRLLDGKGASELSESTIAQGAVEQVLKQGNSAVIAPLFWFAALGPVGAVVQQSARFLHRLWDLRNERFTEFGWAAAQLNEIIGWLPARVTALSYAIMGSFEDALRCWRYQAGMWSFDNSGALLASGFGAMQMQSCEPAPDSEASTGKLSVTTVVPGASHVQRSAALVRRVLVFWLVLALLVWFAAVVLG